LKNDTTQFFDNEEDIQISKMEIHIKKMQNEEQFLVMRKKQVFQGFYVVIGKLFGYFL